MKLHDKQAALEKLGRALRLFAERVELTGKDGGPIEMTEADPYDEIRRRIIVIGTRLGTGEVPEDPKD